MITNIKRFVKPALICLFSLASAVFISSCGKDNGGGNFQIRLTISPPLQTGPSSLPVIYSQLNIISGPLNLMYIWDGSIANSPLSNFQSEEYSVAKGQNVQFSIGLIGNDFLCRQVKLEGWYNGKILKTYNLELGYKYDPTNTVQPIKPCKDALLNFAATNYNFIIP